MKNRRELCHASNQLIFHHFTSFFFASLRFASLPASHETSRTFIYVPSQQQPPPRSPYKSPPSNGISNNNNSLKLSHKHNSYSQITYKTSGVKMMHMNNNRVKRTPSKVISIPVHFVGSERSRTESATKIQKVAKGFLVRKSVKKMLTMKVELEEIENTVNAPETVELMRKEQKEKVRIAETIMNLLLKLDSVRVFHCSALRDFRKSLIKRAIAIQEFVDQIQLVPQSTQVAAAATAENEMNDFVNVEEENNYCLVNEEEEHGDQEKEEGEKIGMDDEGEEEEDCVVKVKQEEKEENSKCGDEDEGEKIGMDDEEEESVRTSFEEEEGCVVKVKHEEEEEEENCKGGDGENREILKRMMEENEKMMNMMTQLFERNEMQTQLLTSLTQRVEQLEKAFTYDRLRRKKRRNLDAKCKLTQL